MKQIILTCLHVGIFLGTTAYAAGAGQDHLQGPCQKIIVACKTAGYVKGGHANHKGMMMDCIQPLMNGTQPAGVSLDPNGPEVASCKKNREAHRKQNGTERQGASGF